MTMLELSEATLAYDVHGSLPPADGRPPLFLVGAPMGAGGFGTLAGYLADRTVVTYDPRGMDRSTRKDGRSEHTPEQNADDVHRIIEVIGGPVEMFASSGGAVTALALVAAHPGDVTTVVAHEPPLITLLPDADRAVAAERAVQAAYREKGWGHGMAAFLALTSWTGEFPEDFGVRLPDPAAFGLPADDDGAREDPLLSGASNPVTAYRPDVAALAAAPTRIVVAVGEESAELLTGRTSVAVARALGQEPVVFPGGHGGFLGPEFGQPGKPEAFAARLREVFDAS
ncbi:alpha/beta fold hydrolase [Blastococcus atacamensis]|uniref:alpha/beta fold hydrolase n=1 Tax=Blastococcus atacamensis TaxID=2070508 RepID=UPI000CEC3C44|nr:alpha/beta hydrolase [Blastococcus atacamensis]